MAHIYISFYFSDIPKFVYVCEKKNNTIPIKKIDENRCDESRLWQYRLWRFQGRDTKLQRFLAKTQLQSNEIIEFCKLV